MSTALSCPMPGKRRRLSVVLQSEASECGLACLAMIAALFGHDVDLGTLRRRYPSSMRGTTLKRLIEIAGALDLAGRAVRVDMDGLSELQLPAILHWDMDHFVVLESVGARRLVIHDPAIGRRRIPRKDAARHVTGIALELTPTRQFKTGKDVTRLTLREAVGPAPGLAKALIQIFCLSVLLELFVLVSPFYMQVAVDEVITRGDIDLLLVLAMGFGLLTIINVMAATLRSLALLSVQNRLGLQMEARLFRHLLRLPLVFFEKRHIGDVLSRLGSVEPIQRLMAEGLVAGILDGSMAVLTLAMLLVYSPVLTLVVVAASAGYAVLRLALYRPLRLRNEEQIRAAADEQSNVIESLRAIQAVKLGNAEAERRGRWFTRAVTNANAHMRLGALQISFKTANDAWFGIENIVTVYLAIRFVLDGSMTLGMIFAFMAYKQQFMSKSALLIDKIIEYRIMSLHLERLGDIALSPAEERSEATNDYGRSVEGAIELKDVSFRYGDDEPMVLNGIDLSIAPGQFVVITGPSGCGKTTLLKIMTGLMEPTAGHVIIDGLPLSAFGRRAYRDRIGAVMQDDQLFAGSLADNISFFDANFDHERMMRVARLAGIHDDIMSMPMSYNSLIGDMGTFLSGGQKQRVLLARALYRQPKILFLDEGTAYLDLETEARVTEALRSLRITRIHIAHRPQVTAAADRLLVLNEAELVEPGVRGTLPPVRQAGDFGQPHPLG